MSDKYYRLVTFVVDICPRPLRKFFLVKAASDQKTGMSFTTLDVYLQARKSDIDTLLRRSIIRMDQYALIYPATGIANLSDWDVTLLITLINQLFKRNLQSPEISSLNGIRDIRNKLQHLSCTGIISDQDFNTYWTGLEHASLQLANNGTGSLLVHQISEEINQAMTENMPGLTNVLKNWYSEINIQLQHHINTLEEKVDQLQETIEKQSAEMKVLKEDTKTSKTILSKASSKRKGRSGVPEKRMKILDIQVERMKDNFTRTFSREIQSGFSSTNETEVSLIIQQLQDNNRVIVSGHINSLTYKTALAAVYKTNYQTGRCLEISNPVDWKRICPDDADIIIFREPFGRSVYDAQKVEVMLEEFDNMLDSTDEDNDDVMKIIIVANQSLLQQVTTRFEHEMLDISSTVFIESDSDLQGPSCLDEKVDHLQAILQKQSSEIAQLKEDAKTSSTILTDVCCKRRGRYGVAEKRIKTVDSEHERMKENLMKSLSRVQVWDIFKQDDLSLIQKKLRDDNRVVISGQNSNVTFKYALRVIRLMGYSLDRCVEISHPVDWRRVSPKDLDLVVFREPFGRSFFDVQKVEMMLEVLDDILESRNDEHEDAFDTIIVASQQFLEKAILLHKHEMMNAEITVFIQLDDEAIGQETIDIGKSDLRIQQNSSVTSMNTMSSVEGHNIPIKMEAKIEKAELPNEAGDAMEENDAHFIDTLLATDNVNHTFPAPGAFHTFEDSRQKDGKRPVEKISDINVTLEDEKIKMQQMRRFDIPLYAVGKDISVCEATDIVRTLGNALEKKSMDYDQIAERHASYSEQYKLQEELFGKMSISNAEYFELYNTTGIDIDNRQQIIKELFKHVEESIVKQVTFAKGIPGFCEFTVNDQAALLKASRFENELTQLGIVTSLQQSLPVSTLPWNKDYHVDEIGRVFPGKFTDLKMKRLKKFTDLALNHDEIALVKALIITFPDRCSLEDAASVERIHNKLIACLLYLLAQRPPDNNVRVQEIVEAVFSMREITAWDTQILQDIFEMYPVASKNNLIKEVCS